MNDDYQTEFKIYRDDIRSFLNQTPWTPQNTFTTTMQAMIQDEQPEQLLDSSTLLNWSSGDDFIDPSLTSSQGQTPHSTSDSSGKCATRKRKAPSTGSGTSSTSIRSEESPNSEPLAQKSRKGHTKSRQGCFNCKKRKIKCQETQPACENCTRKSIECVYPAPKTLAALRVSTTYSPSPIASIALQGTPTAFTLTDMRLFHHYLFEAYPHLPVGNDTTWLSQVPLIAHHVSVTSLYTHQ
jgi:hypothetical protein